MNSTGFGAQGFRECLGDYRDEADLERNELPLYRFQTALPRLPVPTLEHTVQLYLETIEPLASAEEFETSKALAQQFLSNNGLGRELQQRLENRAKARHDTSYLAEWWNTLGYLQVRDPVVFNVSYFFHFADSVHPNQRSNVGRAAALLRATMEFRQQVADGTLEPEQLGPKKTPLCATAYKYMFNACRIPRKNQDTYRIYDPARFNHIVVMRHNKFFKLDMLDETTREMLSFDQLVYQLNRIVAMAQAKESAIGMLSSANRDFWADARAQLIEDGNEDALRVIESAIIVLNLDDSSPISRQEVARGLWHGDGANRFFDKCVQLIVFENGKAGLLGEHSMLDGMPMSVYSDYMITRLHRNQISLGRADRSMDQLSGTLPAHPKQVVFKFSTRTLRAIEEATRVFQQTVADHEVHVESYYGYGKNRIKNFRVSPDAFAQLAIQLAYKKLFGVNAATYEASQTRVFLHGRTETTRTCSSKSAAFTELMVKSPSVADKAEKKQLLLDAAKAHVSYMRKAAQGHGVDRHLLALRLLLQPQERCAFLEDPMMQKARYWLISTSHLTNELFDGWGWGEVVPEGLGIAYSIKNLSIQFNIACRKQVDGNWASRMGHLLEESLVEMAALFDEEALKKPMATAKL